MKERIINEGQHIMSAEQKKQVIETGEIPVLIPERKFYCQTLKK